MISVDWFRLPSTVFFFFFNDTATTEIYTLSLHDALPILLPIVNLDFAEANINPPRFNGLTILDQLDRGVIEDRKSTRLNSSHGYISYAVFCLKKKKTHHLRAHPLSDPHCTSSSPFTVTHS